MHNTKKHEKMIINIPENSTTSHKTKPYVILIMIEKEVFQDTMGAVDLDLSSRTEE